jgi:hypothetical protein
MEAMVRRSTKSTRQDKSRDWVPVFLAALRQCGVINHAAARAGIDRTTVYVRRDADPAFREALAAALEDATDKLEEVAWKRATKASDRLLIFLLKARRYPNAVQVTGAGGQPLFDVEAQRAALANPDALRHVAALNAILARPALPGGPGAPGLPGPVEDGAPPGAGGLGADDGGGRPPPAPRLPDAGPPRQE